MKNELGLYRFQQRDTPIIRERVRPGTDNPNIYGQVIFSKDELRLREKDGLVSIWNGARLEATVKV